MMSTIVAVIGACGNKDKNNFRRITDGLYTGTLPDMVLARGVVYQESEDTLQEIRFTRVVN